MNLTSSFHNCPQLKEYVARQIRLLKRVRCKSRLFSSSKATPRLKQLRRRATILWNACVLGDSYRVTWLTSSVSFSRRKVLSFFLFYGWGNQDSERLSNLLKSSTQ